MRRVVEAEVTATSEVKTKLLIGSSANYEVQIDGKSIGTGKGAGKEVRPDHDAFDVTLPAGKHTLTIAVKDAAPATCSTRASSTPTASCGIPTRARRSEV